MPWLSVADNVKFGIEDQPRSLKDELADAALTKVGLTDFAGALPRQLSGAEGRAYTPLGAWYHASKHALEGWSDCLRLEAAEFGVRVVLIEPGAIQTEFGEVAMAPLLQRSETGPYSATARKMAAATRRTFAGGKASPPSGRATRCG